MEGKALILSVLIMSLVMAQIQVEATKSCCPSPTARSMFNGCVAAGGSQIRCASQSGCKIISGTKCPPGFDNEYLENSVEDVNKYCNLGCASSVCGALTTLENSDASEIVKEALAECTKACSTLCAKGSKTALDQIA